MPLGVAHLAQVVVKGKYDGQDYRNVLHFGTNVEVHDANRNALLLALALAVMECFIEHLLFYVSPSFVLESVTAKEVYPALSDEVEQVPEAGDGVGGAAGDGLPGFASQLVQIKTGKGGRTKRGRMFLPPPPEGQNAQGTMTAGQYTAILAFLACIAGKFIGANKTSPWALGVLSRKGMATASDYANATFTEASQLTASRTLGVMRRRRIGHGS